MVCEAAKQLKILLLLIPLPSLKHFWTSVPDQTPLISSHMERVFPKVLPMTVLWAEEREWGWSGQYWEFGKDELRSLARTQFQLSVPVLESWRFRDVKNKKTFMRICELRTLQITLPCWVSTGTRAGKNTLPLTWSHSPLSQWWWDSEQTGSETAVGKRNIFCALSESRERRRRLGCSCCCEAKAPRLEKGWLWFDLVFSWVLGGAVWGSLCKNWDSVWQLIPENPQRCGVGFAVFMLCRLWITGC